MKLSLNKENAKNKPVQFRHLAKNLKAALKEVSLFLVFFFLFILNKICAFLVAWKRTPANLKPRIQNLENRVVRVSTELDKKTSGTKERMQRFEVYELCFRGMQAKKTRSLVTIGGMAIGVGAIVFLVSIGYGLQSLVIDRVARLEELRQADVSVQPGSNVRLDGKAVEVFKEMEGVQDAVPLIGLAAKLDFNGSKSDVAAYGVETEYLRRSAITTSGGEWFNTDEANFDPYEMHSETEVRESSESEPGAVQGVSDERPAYSYGDEIGEIAYRIFPKSWLTLREQPNTSAKILGYTRGVEGVQHGKEIFGGQYQPAEKGEVLKNPDGSYLGRWVYTEVYLWEKKECSDEAGCEEQTYIPVLDESGRKAQKAGYIGENEVLVLSGGWNSISQENGENGAVLGLQSTSDDSNTYTLGESTDSQALASLGIAEDDVTWLKSILNIETTEGGASTAESSQVKMHPQAQKEVIINTAVLQILNLSKDEALEKGIDISFVITSDLLDDGSDKKESEYTKYTIVGVVADDSTPFIYVPLKDVQSLGIKKYSQVKVISKNETALLDVRKNIESLGYVTNSVSDTVAQINRLFGTTRLLFGIVGSIALGVAAFGMFNTLTVSLLERTREVGLMKAMGMTSDEVKSLFLAESLLMGLLGGLTGIFLGFMAGQVLSLILSIFGVAKGVGVLSVSTLPILFVFLVFALSLTVGLVTGLYPAKRATKISALDALRYE